MNKYTLASTSATQPGRVQSLEINLQGAPPGSSVCCTQAAAQRAHRAFRPQLLIILSTVADRHLMQGWLWVRARSLSPQPH